MNKQQQEVKAMYRDSDPTTSAAAAAEVPIAKAQAIAMTAARNLCLSHGDCTANEVAENGSGLGVNAETIRKRVHELVLKGLLVVVGTRRCRVTGAKARTFQVKQ